MTLEHREPALPAAPKPITTCIPRGYFLAGDHLINSAHVVDVTNLWGANTTVTLVNGETRSIAAPLDDVAQLLDAAIESTLRVS
jgi:hypothetical protein